MNRMVPLNAETHERATAGPQSMPWNLRKEELASGKSLSLGSINGLMEENTKNKSCRSGMYSSSIASSSRGGSAT